MIRKSDIQKFYNTYQTNNLQNMNALKNIFKSLKENKQNNPL